MKTSLRNPHRRAIVTLSGLVGLALLAALALWGLSLAGRLPGALIWIAVVILVVLFAILVVIWVLGQLEIRRAGDFLESQRPLARWVYGESEWFQLKKARWMEEKDDWKVQFGCLTFLLALAGLLTGLLIGIDQGGAEIIVHGLLGLILGALVGAGLGAFVAGGNLLGAWLDYRQSKPGMVALGRDEIYASDGYFRSDGVRRVIRRATLHRERSTWLEFQLAFPPRVRMPDEEEWIIPVPEAMIEEVERILPLISIQEPSN